jgi:hypothetical protein
MNFADRHPYIILTVFVVAYIVIILSAVQGYLHALGYVTVLDRFVK